VAAGIRGELEAVAALADAAPRRRVLFVVGRDPLYVAGPGSHIDRMIRLVGGRNVAEDALAPYQQVSLEVILERLPEVIVDASDNDPQARRGRVAGEWQRWGFLPAVRDRRVYSVDPGALVIPGLRLPEMTRLLGRLVHPEIYGEALPSELER
jgi:ABC-type Fe3+-hydroxamate transport system substrate-binding protein